MTVTDASEPACLLRLLWRSRLAVPARRGPKARVSIDQIVAAGIALADRDGAEAPTIRAVAASVGVAPMTIYSHVPDKATLVALMVDQALRDMPTTPIATDPIERLGNVLDDNHRLYLAHPWLIAAYTERPPMGPGVIGKYERELAAFDGMRLSALDVDSALTFLLNFARSAAADVVAARAEAERGSAGDWWAALEPELTALISAADYPLATAIGTQAGEALGGAYNADHAYRFGRARVLTAIAELADPGASE
ncbi:TetR/AcrR family transcriptional regulator [Stackebrandtia soli]|uniref:TetR/AcrR family transcriptional regulator n=1 Tax=Stackebrandtia soli TaxID=1892856 RepID=UPI0039EC773F